MACSIMCIRVFTCGCAHACVSACACMYTSIRYMQALRSACILMVRTVNVTNKYLLRVKKKERFFSYQTSIADPYSTQERSSSGALYQRVTTYLQKASKR